MEGLVSEVYGALTPPERTALVERTIGIFEEEIGEWLSDRAYDRAEHRLNALQRSWEGDCPAEAVRDTIRFWLHDRACSPGQVVAMVKERE
jgi:hypothetical protein